MDISKKADHFFEKMRHTFCEQEEVPVLSKPAAVGKFLWSIVLFVFMVVMPPTYFYIFFLHSLEKHSFFKAIILTPFYTISIWWSETIQQSFFECKRSFGFHTEPVYKWVIKKDGKTVVLSALDMMREAKKRNKEDSTHKA